MYALCMYARRHTQGFVYTNISALYIFDSRVRSGIKISLCIQNECCLVRIIHTNTEKRVHFWMTFVCLVASKMYVNHFISARMVWLLTTTKHKTLNWKLWKWYRNKFSSTINRTVYYNSGHYINLSALAYCWLKHCKSCLPNVFIDVGGSVLS